MDPLLDAQIQQPRAQVDVYQLPIGILGPDDVLHNTVTLRGMRLRQEEMLANDSVPWAVRTDEILKDCIISIGSLKIDRDTLPQILLDARAPDREGMMIALRRRSLGDIMPLREECPLKDCKFKNRYDIDLSQITAYPMRDPLLRRYTVTLPSGRSAELRPLDGHGERIRDTLKARLGAIALTLMMRIVSLDGQPATESRVLDLDSRDRDAIRAAMIENEGDLDTTLKLKCKSPRCGYEFERELSPFMPGFFFPSETQATWTRRSNF